MNIGMEYSNALINPTDTNQDRSVNTVQNTMFVALVGLWLVIIAMSNNGMPH